MSFIQFLIDHVAKKTLLGTFTTLGIVLFMYNITQFWMPSYIHWMYILQLSILTILGAFFWQLNPESESSSIYWLYNLVMQLPAIALILFVNASHWWEITLATLSAFCWLIIGGYLFVKILQEYTMPDNQPWHVQFFFITVGYALIQLGIFSAFEKYAQFASIPVALCICVVPWLLFFLEGSVLERKRKNGSKTVAASM